MAAADDDGDLSAVGFMFDSEAAKTQRHFDLPGGARVCVGALESESGALQSGHYVWGGAVGLAAYLCGPAPAVPVRGARVLELGAGTGLAGLAAAAAGAQSVALTDHDPGVLALLADNAALNGVAAHIADLAWGGAFAGGDVDLVIGADVVYCEGVVAPLFATVAAARAPFLMAQSFDYEPGVEVAIAAAAARHGLSRRLLVGDFDTVPTGEAVRIQLFSVGDIDGGVGGGGGGGVGGGASGSGDGGGDE